MSLCVIIYTVHYKNNDKCHVVEGVCEVCRETYFAYDVLEEIITHFHSNEHFGCTSCFKDIRQYYEGIECTVSPPGDTVVRQMKYMSE